ncbi:MAG: Dam family site-specific DNA-(adenine-N6)-methyltransferase [Acidobacteria bacterium]|nr:Dam family site-specific DNA-(adenine-N6)-methyltransferase [Acidobacteriota bacterium]
MTTASSEARPFLKWAGGKRQLLPQLRRFYPERFRAYHEPFLGSGAVFFDLAAGGRLRRGAVRLTDVNLDLIGCWLQVRDAPDAVIDRLRTLESGHGDDPAGHYYRIRDEQFNPARRDIMHGPGAYTPDLAAMLIYLNRTGYNGLFRLNSKGMFNVPRGRYVKPRICDADNLGRVAAKLSDLAAAIDYQPYRQVLHSAGRGDFIYFDPPYAPLSATARFTSYTAGGFTGADQQQLQQVVVELAERGCHVLLSNSTAPEVAELYDENREALRVGIRAHKVAARRAINSAAARRGAIMEYAITNMPERAA